MEVWNKKHKDKPNNYIEMWSIVKYLIEKDSDVKVIYDDKYYL